MEEDNRPSDTVPADSDVKPAEGDEKVSDESQPGESDIASLSLEELKGTLGREFKSKEDALKSIKDTYAFVGKKQEAAPEQSKEEPSARDEIDNLKQELFFTQRPELKDARPILDALAKANGQSLQEAAESDVFKETFSKIKGFDESQEKRTVMDGARRFDGGAEDTQKEFSNAIGDKEKMAEFTIKHFLNKE